MSWPARGDGAQRGFLFARSVGKPGSCPPRPLHRTSSGARAAASPFRRCRDCWRRSRPTDATRSGRLGRVVRRAACWPGFIAAPSRAYDGRFSQSIRPLTGDFWSAGKGWGSRALGGPVGTREAIARLQGFEMPAGAWEQRVLAARMADYDPAWLDQLFMSGELVWGRLCPPRRASEDGPSMAGLTRHRADFAGPARRLTVAAAGRARSTGRLGPPVGSQGAGDADRGAALCSLPS